ncbi:hypothetical protein [Parendozoicomonas haliclonae]|uniref:Uncharacterized protein n=1 Tax=Parendozoicomonas haliclonae TaxID=1960125 RepID=A0A1X7AJ32_9GAMM|nr:hypothetical protein [Parendozoicomonas haliclonae]SMA40148.1 hypothetical protein EHSB41UT_01147 [Parendozoicomonas haliclonae]
MTKPCAETDLPLDVPSSSETVTISTPVKRLEGIITDALASGLDINKYLAQSLIEGGVSKTEALEAMLYAVSLGGSSVNATYH